MNLRNMLLASAGLAGLSAAAALPVVSDVALTQDASRTVTVSYRLQNAPCVVTLDIQTNTLADATGDWASIGGANFSNVTGDVFREVEARADGAYAIRWKPHLSWPDRVIAAGGVRAVVTAWANDDRPDILVVGLTENVQDRVRYYPSVDFLPGGLFDNEAYRTSSIVMKRIHARGVTWIKGSQAEEVRDTDGREEPYEVTLPADYYIGVFQLTQQQWYTIAGSYRGGYAGPRRRMRPLESTSFARMRECDIAANTPTAAYEWPADPHPSSFLGRLRARTGLPFDLPGDAEWEFAARGGHGERCWGDGVMMTYASRNNDDHLAQIVRCAANNDTANTDDPDRGGTSEVGHYRAPNSYGLYDMCGNVAEFCLDFFTANADTLKAKTQGEIVTRTESTLANHVIHGCNPAQACYHRPARKNGRNVNLDDIGTGFRLILRGLLDTTEE